MARTYTCSECGQTNPNWRCYRCKPKQPRNHGASKPTKFVNGRFIAIDGEGTSERDEQGNIVPGGRHYYNLLAAQTPDGARSIRNFDGELSTKECLDFLLDIGEQYPHDIAVVFGGSYDFNMMLGDATKDNIAELWATRDDDTHYTRITGTNIEVSFLPKKYYKVRQVCDNPKFLPTGRKDSKGEPEYRRNVIRSIVVWDVVGFFQSTFVTALEGYKIVAPELIKEMKARRSQFTADERETITRYCLSECGYLVDLMNKLREAMVIAGIQVRRWDGAGAVAAALMMREKVKDHMQETAPERMEATRIAYFGGRIELIKYGDIPKYVYQHDINSAYPSVMQHLPSLAGGTWTLGDRRTPFSVSHIRWKLKEAPFYPFPYRVVTGRIYYPREGEAWVWEPELAAAERWNKSGIEVLETWSFTPQTHGRSANEPKPKPFDFIPRLFQQRKAFKARGSMAEKALKLGINSLYGKTAQQKGGKIIDGKPVAPPFFQLEWAGYITSATRAKLYDTAMQAPESIIAFATDGIFSLKPLSLDVGPELGQWERTTWRSAVFAQSGVYWLEKMPVTYEREEQRYVSHYRGFDSNSLDRNRVRDSLINGVPSYQASQTRFVTMGQALAQDFGQWRRWVTRERDLRLTPEGTKRVLVGPNTGIRRTKAPVVYFDAFPECSEPFAIEWLDGKDAMPQAYKSKANDDDMGYE